MWKSYCIRGDKHKLTQVIHNLVSNALKFTPRGGTVTVELVHVSDNQNSDQVAREAVTRTPLLLGTINHHPSVISLSSFFMDMPFLGSPSPDNHIQHTEQVDGRENGRVHPLNIPAAANGVDEKSESDVEEVVVDGFVSIRVTDSGAGISLVRDGWAESHFPIVNAVPFIAL